MSGIRRWSDAGEALVRCELLDLPGGAATLVVFRFERGRPAERPTPSWSRRLGRWLAARF